MSSRSTGPSTSSPRTTSSRIGSTGTSISARSAWRTAKNLFCSSRNDSIDCSQHLGLYGACSLRFGAHDVQIGDAIVPFDESRDPTEASHRLPIEVPDGLDDGSVVGVEQVGAHVGVSGQVDLADTVTGEAGQVRLGRKAMVHGADVDVVDVEEQSAVGSLGDGAQELPLLYRRVRVSEIAGDIFEQDLAAEPFLHGQDALYDVVERLLGVWQGQQVMRVVAA